MAFRAVNLVRCRHRGFGFGLDFSGLVHCRNRGNLKRIPFAVVVYRNNGHSHRLEMVAEHGRLSQKLVLVVRSSD